MHCSNGSLGDLKYPWSQAITCLPGPRRVEKLTGNCGRPQVEQADPVGDEICTPKRLDLSCRIRQLRVRRPLPYYADAAITVQHRDLQVGPSAEQIDNRFPTTWDRRRAATGIGHARLVRLGKLAYRTFSIARRHKDVPAFALRSGADSSTGT